MGLSKRNNPEPCAPQTISDDRWGRLCDGVQDAMAARTEEAATEYGAVLNGIADNARWN